MTRVIVKAKGNNLIKKDISKNKKIFSKFKKNDIIKGKSKITIGFCCKNYDYTFINYLNGLNENFDVIVKLCDGVNNTLTECYNKIINESKTDIVIIMHNDVYFEKIDKYNDTISNIFIKLFKDNPEFGVIGVVGGLYIDDEDPKWAGGITYGHFVQEHKYISKETEYINLGKIKPFSYSIVEVIGLDGMFFAIDKTRIKYLFDETNHSFNFYDIDFSIGNHIRGCKVGVTKSILLRHKSDGNYNEKYKIDKEFFKRKYNFILPLDISDKIGKIENKGQLEVGGKIFDECYILHMAESTDRYDSIIKTLKKVDAYDNFKIWWTCKRNITKEISKKWYKGTDFTDNFKNSLFNCSLEHYTMIKTSYERGLNMILICEDDIVFKKNPFKRMNDIICNAPNDWDIIKFITFYEVFEEKECEDINEDLFKSTKNVSAACYAINKKGMKKLMDYYRNKLYVIDDSMLDLNIYFLKGEKNNILLFDNENATKSNFEQ